MIGLGALIALCSVLALSGFMVSADSSNSASNQDYATTLATGQQQQPIQQQQISTTNNEAYDREQQQQQVRDQQQHAAPTKSKKIQIVYIKVPLAKLKTSAGHSAEDHNKTYSNQQQNNNSTKGGYNASK